MESARGPRSVEVECGGKSLSVKGRIRSWRTQEAGPYKRTQAPVISLVQTSRWLGGNRCASSEVITTVPLLLFGKFLSLF